MRIFPAPFFVAAFVATLPLGASASGPYISKISTAGTAVHEWVEVSNDDETAVDLTGWKFWEANTNHGLKTVQGDMSLTPGGRVIIANDATTFLAEHPTSTLVVLDSSWGTLTDDGEEIGLRDPSGTLVESFVYPATGGKTIIRDGSEATLDWCQAPETDVAGLEYLCSPPPPPTPVIIVTPEPEITPDATSTPPTPDLPTVDVPTTTSTPIALVLSEIFPAPSSGGKEWIELWNDGAADVPGEACTLSDSASKIADIANPIPARTFAVVELSSSKLNNDGDTVKLYCGGELLDSVTYGSDATPAPDSGQSLARASLPGGAWQVTVSPTPGSANSISEPETAVPVRKTTDAVLRKYPVGRVLVNEIFPGSQDQAWIELVNPESKSISLDGWKLVVDTSAPIQLAGTLAADSRLVIDRLTSPLDGARGIVFLIDPQGYTSEQVVWGDGTPTDNAPGTTVAGTSIARQTDGLDTGRPDTDFVVTATPTPGKPNVTRTTDDASDTVRISELLPDPEGTDADGEFVELENFGATTVHLSGWTISIGGHAPKRLPEIELAPLSFRSFSRTELKQALPNSGSTIDLFAPNGALTDETVYSKPEPGSAYARNGSDGWSWTTDPTAGASNSIVVLNHEPEATIDVIAPETGDEYVFDASDSNDEDGPLAAIVWNFGDGGTSDATTTSHSFLTSGRHTVTLTVLDPAGASSTTKKNIQVPTRSVSATVMESPTTPRSTKVVPKAKATVASKKKTTVAKKTTVKATILEVSGIALSKPGVLGSRLVPIATVSGNELIELPKTTDRILAGDLVTTEGTVGTRNGIRIIKVKTYSASAGTIPDPAIATELDNVSDLPEYGLATATGMIVEANGRTLTLSRDGELRVLLPTTGKRAAFVPGTEIAVTGLIRTTKDDSRELVVREISDVTLTKTAPLDEKNVSRRTPISPVGAGAAGTASGVLATVGWGATGGIRKRIMESIAALRPIRTS